MKTLFVDTFYFLALVNPADAAHEKAVAFTRSNAFRLVTTAWVLTELGDALAASEGGRRKFLDMLEDLEGDPEVTIIGCDDALMARGVELYGRRLDKQWSLTDCISFVAMSDRAFTEALTGDRHFEQAGFISLLK